MSAVVLQPVDEASYRLHNPRTMSSVQGGEPVLFTVTYDVENGVRLSPPKRNQLSITLDLARLFGRAAAVNRNDSTPLSFTSLFAAMLTDPADIGIWLRDLLGSQGVTSQKIGGRRSRNVDENMLSSVFQAPSNELAASMSARRAIEEAQTVAFTLSAGAPVDVRHLVAAYPILRDWHDDDFNELSIDRLSWCRALGEHMAATFPAERWFWREYADRASPVPLTSFSADVYTEKDLLGIDRSVEALALLMASTRTDTPLSIGVFGPWGSGKSFFMRHLRRRIWDLAEREQRRVADWIEKRKQGTATADDAPLYYGQVAQVEFNAWHYNEGNLVASLVDHLFRNLRVLPDKKDKELEERRTAVLLQIAGAEGQVKDATKAIEERQQQVKDAKAQVQRAESDAASARRQIDEKSRELDACASDAEQARTQIDEAIKALAADAAAPDANAIIAVALQPLTDSPAVAAIRDTVDRIAREAVDWRQFASQLVSTRGLVVVALLLAVPVVAWFTNQLSAQWAALSGLGATAFAGVGRAVTYLRERRQLFEAKLAELRRAEEAQRATHEKALRDEAARIDEQWQRKLAALRTTLEEQRKALATRESALAAAVSALAEQTKELDRRMQERTSAEAMLRDAEAQLKRLSSALLLDEFIKDRSATDEYRKQLGFLALVRRDFERLSDLISAANAEWCDPKKDAAPPLLNRIVLYIDDLDRCKVETVLSVLEAVHLLLAFPLFVCVVAVDPRWIEECLRQKHQELFAVPKPDAAVTNGSVAAVENVRVTVGDYLEKIFQIPIWTRAIDQRQRATLVKSLLGSTAAPEPKGTARGDAAAQDPPPPPKLGERQPVGAMETDGFIEAVNKAQEHRDPLRITSGEAQFVDRVAPLLSDKPRALKRFVNTYRLLKASLPDINRRTFVTDDQSSPHKICISQLAFFTGRPRLAPALVQQLAKAQDAQGETVNRWLESLPTDSRAPLADAVNLVPEAGEMRLSAFCEWLPETAKYLFHRGD